MSDTSKTPFAELIVDGTRLAGRTEALDLSRSFAAPLAGGWIALDDHDGEAGKVVKKNAELTLVAGRRGESEITLLTGIVAGEAEHGNGAAEKHILRARLADRWAVAARVSVVETLMDVTPQEVLDHVFGLAGLTDKRLTGQAFERRHQVVLSGETLAGAVSLVKLMWEIGDWAAGFDGEGTFFWEPWAEHAGATGDAAAFDGDELLLLETDRTGGGRLELFFEPGLFPGGRIKPLEEPEGRIEHVRHVFDGARFRTEVAYGPLPS